MQISIRFHFNFQSLRHNAFNLWKSRCILHEVKEKISCKLFSVPNDKISIIILWHNYFLHLCKCYQRLFTLVFVRPVKFYNIYPSNLWKYSRSLMSSFLKENNITVIMILMFNARLFEWNYYILSFIFPKIIIIIMIIMVLP